MAHASCSNSTPLKAGNCSILAFADATPQPLGSDGSVHVGASINISGQNHRRFDRRWCHNLKVFASALPLLQLPSLSDDGAFNSRCRGFVPAVRQGNWRVCTAAFATLPTCSRDIAPRLQAFEQFNEFYHKSDCKSSFMHNSPINSANDCVRSTVSIARSPDLHSVFCFPYSHTSPQHPLKHSNQHPQPRHSTGVLAQDSTTSLITCFNNRSPSSAPPLSTKY